MTTRSAATPSPPDSTETQGENSEYISIRDEWPVLKEPLVVKDSHIAVPDGPGLGVELDEKVLKTLTER